MSDDKQPSNDALRKEIDALAAELELDISHSGKNKAELIQLREELLAKQAELAAAPAEAAPPAPAGAQRAAVSAPSSEPPQAPGDDSDEDMDDEDMDDEDMDDEDMDDEEPRLCVAPGTSISTRRGILGPGTEVKLEDFTGSVEEIKARARALFDSGALVVG